MGNQINITHSNKPIVNYWMISALLLAFLLLGSWGLNIFSTYKAGQSDSIVDQRTCSHDGDCTIGIQADFCCSCPKAVNKKLIGTNDWEQYEFGKDYSSQQIKSCGGTVYCKPCEFADKPICSVGTCQFPSQADTQPSDTQKQKTGVILRLDTTTYRSGEPIGFTITNNTQQNIYYFPESCAGSLVQAFKATDENSPPIGDPVVCLLQPSVQTLSTQQSITGNIRDKTLLMMTPGRYKIKFYYSLEKRDRFAIGAQSVIESEMLTIVN